MNRQMIKSKIGRIAAMTGRVLLFPLTLLVVLLLTLYATLMLFCHVSEAAEATFITTVLETGQMKFLASLCLPHEEIDRLVQKNSMQSVTDDDIDEGLIIIDAQGKNPTVESRPGTVIDTQESCQKEIEVIHIAGLTYNATLMIVQDPSRVSLETLYQGNGAWPSKGITLQEFVSNTGAIGGINGGLYNSTNNSGGYPYGVVVSHGEIVRNAPREMNGLVLVGLTEQNILQIVDISHMNTSQVEQMIAEKGIRDAVCFQEEITSDNNHFVQLVINGVPREMTGAGSGLNPRTAIGQRADGALLLLVTDGRGYRGHAGASAADLTDIMVRYGAVNAANLDGGSSTCMYYDGMYLQDSVTFYYSQSSWRLPFAFLIH